MATKSDRSFSLMSTSVRLIKRRCSSLISSETRLRIGGIRKSPRQVQFTVRTRMRTFFPSGTDPSVRYGGHVSSCGARTSGACATSCICACAFFFGASSERSTYDNFSYAAGESSVFERYREESVRSHDGLVAIGGVPCPARLLLCSRDTGDGLTCSSIRIPILA